MTQPGVLHRFVDAQNGIYGQVCAELRAGRKASHWMWFIFPQLAGLGHSQMARRFAISSLAEARAYLNHPLLGARLRECTRLVTSIEGRTVEQIFGNPDDLKFRSSMTLFSSAAADNDVFLEGLSKYFGGEPDRRTIELLHRE